MKYVYESTYLSIFFMFFIHCGKDRCEQSFLYFVVLMRARIQSIKMSFHFDDAQLFTLQFMDEFVSCIYFSGQRVLLLRMVATQQAFYCR